MYNKITFIFWFIYTKYFLKFRNRSTLEKYQTKKLNNLYLCWSDRFSREEFFNCPIIDKKDYLDSFQKYNRPQFNYNECLSFAQHQEMIRSFKDKLNGFSIGLSSGTSGRSGIFITSDHEQAKWFGIFLARTLSLQFIIRRLCKFKKIKVTLILRNNNNLYESSSGKIVEFNFIDLMNDHDIYQKICDINPDILIAPATVLSTLADKNLMRSCQIRPLMVLSVAEVLENKEHLEKAFACPIQNIYQTTEGFLGYTCHKGNMHLNEYFIKFSRIEIAPNLFYPIISDFSRETQLFNRFVLDDLIEIDEHYQCGCGSKELVITKILGRRDEIIEHNSRTIFPDQIRQIFFTSQNKIEDYMVIYSKSEASLEVLLVPLSQEISGEISAKLKYLFNDNKLCIKFNSKPQNNKQKNIRIRVIN